MKQGEILAIMGSSGSGKSTLLHIVGAMDTASEGEIYLNGKLEKRYGVEPNATKIRSENIGFIFQSFHLIQDFTVEENVSLPLVLAGEKSKVIRTRTEEMLALVGLEDKGRSPDDINKIAETFRDNSLQCCTLLGEFGFWNVSDAIQRQRQAMIKIVMLVLILVAGIGWLNSAKGTLVAMREEYRVLRILDSTDAKVKRVCWVQVWSYMLAGILLGIVMGVVIVYFFWRNNLVVYSRIRIYWENVFGIVVYLVGLSLLLYPTINKVSMKNEKLN